MSSSGCVALLEQRRAAVCAPAPLATVVVAHASPLMRAGIVHTLRQLPRCAVHVWERGPICDHGPAAGGTRILVADRERAALLLRRCTAPGAACPRVVLMDARAEDDGASEPHGVDRRLPVECGEEDLLDAVRHLSEGPQDAASARPAPRALRGGLAPSALRRVREHVEQHLNTRITVDELAAMAGLSACHFARAFRQSLGAPPHRYILQRRLQRAADVVASTSRPLAEIASELGFADQSHFTRAFAESFGQTPHEFRLRHR